MTQKSGYLSNWDRNENQHMNVATDSQLVHHFISAHHQHTVSAGVISLGHIIAVSVIMCNLFSQDSTLDVLMNVAGLFIFTGSCLMTESREMHSSTTMQF